MKSAPPTAKDLQNLWASTKVIDPASEEFADVDWGTAVSDAISEFQSETGRRLLPLWQTRYFDPPAGPTARLPFKSDLCSAQNIAGTTQSQLVQSVAPVGNVEYANGRTLTVTLQGTGIVTNSDFYWGPNNAAYEGAGGEGKPWTWIDFQNFFPSPLQVYLRQSIAITGYWGYIAPDANSNPQIPVDIWHAILHMAALEVIPEIELAISRAREQVQTQTARYKFNALGPQREMWTRQSRRTIERHTKVEYF